MQIFVLRHGIAETGRAGESDSERALAPEGKKKLRQVLRVARSAGMAPDLILTSPYRRAVETAEIAGKILGYPGDIIKTDSLRPGSTPEDVWEELRAFESAGHVLLTGHQPQLSYLAGYLLSSPSLLVELKPGSLIRVDVEPAGLQPHGVLRWHLTPKLASGFR
jgi:phosphohistidine phosphatase